MPEITLPCATCGQQKPASHFPIDGLQADRACRSTQCRVCTKRAKRLHSALHRYHYYIGTTAP